jgi:hypothetical protein
MRKTRGRCRSSFFHIEDKRPLCVIRIGPAKHPGTSRRYYSRSFSPFVPHAPHGKSNVWHTPREFFLHPSYNNAVYNESWFLLDKLKTSRISERFLTVPLHNIAKEPCRLKRLQGLPMYWLTCLFVTNVSCQQLTH